MFCVALHWCIDQLVASNSYFLTRSGQVDLGLAACIHIRVPAIFTAAVVAAKCKPFKSFILLFSADIVN